MGEMILLFGASGTIGRATAAALRKAGYKVVTPLRPSADRAPLAGCEVIDLDIGTLPGLMMKASGVVSCLASRTGTPKDSWAVDYKLNSSVLKAAVAAGVPKFVLLSAICVQKPLLDFQRAKLQFERELMDAPLNWSIVRSTAYFKSLSGQIDRVLAGKPFLVFGDGTLTACKPISDPDLASFLVSCLSDPERQNRILPIGGPGPAITPLDQVDMLEALIGARPKVKQVSPRILKTIAGVLSWIPPLKEKAALARIGHYYATESMLHWNGTAYDADATPEFGTDSLMDHYQALIQGQVENERGSHAVF